MNHDTLFAEKRWNGFAIWTYSDGLRFEIGTRADVDDVYQYAKRRHYRIVWVK